MPWYSLGSAAVTANSATVTGTGTAFSANGRVGDAFRGPDGRWYEITNIASATVLSIRPNYQGATASGQAYAIAPMQGYVKESADRLRQLVDQYGSQLAALQPWAYAATAGGARNALGATAIGNAMFTAADQAAGRTALGLGTAATANVQTSPTDTTAGALMAVGAFGLGGTGAPCANVDAWLSNGVYAVDSSTTGKPSGSTYGQLIVTVRAMDATTYRATQLFFESLNSGSMWARYHGGDGWSAWRPVTPERGSNANGEYTKYADGTMECWTYVSLSEAIATSEGAGFYVTSPHLIWTYPAAFTGQPSAGGWLRYGAVIAGGIHVYTAGSGSLAYVPWASRSLTAATSKYAVLYAKGRWY